MSSIIGLSIKKLFHDASLLINNDIIKELLALNTDGEPLLAENADMFVFGNMNANDIEENKLYLKHQLAYWPAEEVSMLDDIRDWINLLYDQTSSLLTPEQREQNRIKNDGARYFLEMVIAFFAAADEIVNTNLIRFVKEITDPYVQKYYKFQMAMEDIHAKAYTIMLQTLVSDPTRQQELFRAIFNIPVVRKKALFALKYINHPDPDHYINQPKSLALRLVALSCMEMIQFSSSFASIYWIRSKGKMPGLSEFNKQIARDEGLHGEHSSLLYKNRIKNKLPEHIVHKVIIEAYEAEKEFFTEALPVALIGINANEMDCYVKLVCNRLSEMLGYSVIWPNVKNPFPFMEKILLNNRNNLHEIAGGDYQNAMVNEALTWGCKMDF
jgi:ribonucleotide reductase beta subunit family protein with ferritin-like domain